MRQQDTFATAPRVRTERGISSRTENAPPSAIARVTRSVRAIERRPDGALGLCGLAREAGLSPYHFLRTFDGLTGTTPHQHVRRARLRDAASRLGTRGGAGYCPRLWFRRASNFRPSVPRSLESAHCDGKHGRRLETGAPKIHKFRNFRQGLMLDTMRVLRYYGGSSVVLPVDLG
jgi:AraC-like DNA-binding protein